MVIVQIITKSLLRRKKRVLIALLAMSFTVYFVLLLTHLKVGLANSMARVSEQAELIVGAPAQPVHLALYGLFRLGNPPPAISYDYVKQLQANPEVASAIPLSQQESHRGHAVTGTSEQLFDSINTDQVFAQGEGFSHPHSVVLGASFARDSGYLPGEQMTIAAGSEPTVDDEYSEPFTITGILAPTGSMLDDGVFVPITTLQDMRSAYNSGAGHDVNLILVKLHSKQATMPMQNQIKTTLGRAFEVIVPGQELAYVHQLVNRVMNVILGILAITVLMALLMVFFSVVGSLAERRQEVQTLRMLGARTHQIVVIGFLEPLAVILLALVAGFVLLLTTVTTLEILFPIESLVWLGGQTVSANEMVALLVILVVGSLLTFVPAWMMYDQCIDNRQTVKSPASPTKTGAEETVGV